MIRADSGNSSPPALDSTHLSAREAPDYAFAQNPFSKDYEIDVDSLRK